VAILETGHALRPGPVTETCCAVREVHNTLPRAAEYSAPLRRQTDIADAITLFRRVTVAVVAVGSGGPPISQIQSVLSANDLRQLDARRVEAEVCGILIDQRGQLVGADFVERCLAISAAELAVIPEYSPSPPAHPRPKLFEQSSKQDS
jgi:hypothetical protein